MTDFHSAWWKWRWAVTHTKALLDELIGWTHRTGGNPLMRTGHEYDPKRHGFRVFISTVEMVPITVGLKLGDAISNYRMSLDHAAWAMVQRGGTPNLPPELATKVYFPFAQSPGHWDWLVTRRLPGVTYADRAIVRRYQPYRRLHLRQTLGLLANLANDDKHRTIQPVLASPIVIRFEVTNPRDCTNLRASRAKLSRRAVNVGTELGYIYCRKTGPNPQIDVNAGALEAEIAITPQYRLDSWLQHTCLNIADFLCAVAVPPFPWDTRVPGWAWPEAGRHAGSPAAPPTQV